MTLAGTTVYPCGSTDTNFDPPEFSLGSIFNVVCFVEVVPRGGNTRRRADQLGQWEHGGGQANFYNST
jgi:hypothetical protein